MEQHRVRRLTEQQRACLRFVYAHMTSKEIAPRLGIEPGSVDQHIKAAMRVLGVGDRRTAARILADHEARAAAESASPTQPLVYQPPEIAFDFDPAKFGPPIESGRHHSSGLSGVMMREEQAAFRIFSSGGAPTLPLPVGTRPSDLNWVARLAWIAAIAIGVALAFGGLVSGVEALVRLTRG
ncbi:MAG TPA: helix-turn-helix transcriptional regulator [Allosphingosinicella sp.]|jgi:DNA-binding CsgD family transcriptional regulator